MIARSIFARLLLAFALAIMAGSWLFRLSAEESRPAVPPPAFATLREVWRAVVSELQKRGLSEEQMPQIEGLDLPAALPALDGRRLRVTSACWDAIPRRTQFRLECDAPAQCLPFLVYVHDRSSSHAGAGAGSCRLAASHPPSTKEALLNSAVRAGDRATAVFHADRLRMTASVTCLERGREGEIIRVRGLDGRVFQARISGPDQLEALPQ